MRFWARTFKNNRMLRDTVVEYYSEDTRTHKVFRALDEACREFDLQRPIWLEINQQDFKKHRKTRFTADSFIESIDFDFLEFMIIEED